MSMILLNGKWRLYNRSKRFSLLAKLPGDTHSALLAAGKIEHPYYGLQEHDAQWIGKEDWNYERNFRVSASVLSQKSVYLHIDRADTVAKIYINGALAGDMANAFVRYCFDVKSLLRVGLNIIRIEFKSAELAAALEAKQLPYPIPHSQFPMQSQHRNLIRKPQCHAGWDWGPCLMVAGVYGDIYLSSTDMVRIEHLSVRQKHVPRQVELELKCEFNSLAKGEAAYEIALEDRRIQGITAVGKGPNVLIQKLTIKEPRLWWPNGYGDQPLYDLTVKIDGDTVRRRVGLRDLKTVLKEDNHGLGFEFCVNGVPIFAKGANWIPADALPQRIDRHVLDDLLTSAVQANMNMIRVWGGGQYESDDFYDLCDEKGLMVWQDFMFSCSLYPSTDSFLSNVRHEVEYQVKRLQHRACLALWCGNNEDVGALNWYEESRRNRDRYLVDYDRLNEGVIGDTVRALDPTRTFWPSSPCGGPGDYSDCWHDDTRGDMHFWSVWHESKPFEDYLKIKPRFCSEFGYQSFPSIEVIQSYAPRDQWNLSSPIMEHHQKNPGGNARITENITRYFRFPEGFENFVYLSQWQQGIAIKTAVEHFRRLRPVCMGALYWQLNDMWPVCSWSSLNYGGKWKPLHYIAKKFFAPLLVSIDQKSDQILEIWGSSDFTEDLVGELTLQIIDFGGKRKMADHFKVGIRGLTSKCLHRFDLTTLRHDPTAVFLEVELKTKRSIARNTHFFSLYKHCDLAKPKISSQVAALKRDGNFEVNITTDVPAFGVTLNADGIRGEFDDNVLTLLPGKGRRLVFAPKQKTNADHFLKALNIRHLRGSYA